MVNNNTNSVENNIISNFEPNEINNLLIMQIIVNLNNKNN